jgi:SnoaL-like domain
MTDRETIQEVVTNVAHYIDHKAWNDLRTLYSDEVETDYTSLLGGEVQRQSRDALIGAWKTMLTPITTQHLLGPVTVADSAETATAHCHVRGYHHVKGAKGGDEWMVAGHYVFELKKRDARWRISSMTLEALYQTGNLKLLEVAGGK